MGIALVFPGQASQFVGMGRNFSNDSELSKLMAQADDVLELPLSSVMMEGPEEELRETNFTQPAVFVHSIMAYLKKKKEFADEIQAVAGHSLGEISALVAVGALSFEDGLRLVKVRAEAMQEACDAVSGTMAAILGMEDEKVEEICDGISDIVVPANYNCPGQLVISGTKAGIQKAIESCNEAGAKRAIEINVGGAFHSPLMKPALERFEKFIHTLTFNAPVVPIYQNVDATPQIDPVVIRDNLIKQIISPVRWTQSIQRMCEDGIGEFVEVGGKGKILMGMIRKINRDVSITIWGENA